MCGVRIEHDGRSVLSVRGDPDDPFSKGAICPKATALADLHHDPDRLQTPRIKRDGRFVEVGWDEAYDEVARRLRAVHKAHGRGAVAIYQGNPTVHSLGAMLYGQLLWRALGTRTRFSATSLDQLPHMLSSLWMYGHQLLVPVPDLDRARCVVVIGANPAVSNGSMMSAAGVRRRLDDMRARGGTLIVIDPRRTETADRADSHHFIRPGTDATLLAGLVRFICHERAPRLGHLAAFTDGLDLVRGAVDAFTPDVVAAHTGLDADVVTTLADELLNKRGLVYGRFGACTQDFGALTAWLINVVNILVGALDVEGGVMFTTPALDVIGLAGVVGQRGHFDKGQSRVRGLPEFGGEFPAACLAEEIDTPGEGQVKALITHAGNPVLSTPNGARLDAALAGLDFMVSIDFYLNETTRHADVILPPSSPLEREHYDAVFHLLAVRNTARWSTPTFARPAHARHDWEIFLALTERLARPGLRARAASWATQALMGRGPQHVVDGLLRIGPHRTSVTALKKSPSGLDFGPLRPCLPARLQTTSKRIALAPPRLVEDLVRLQAALSSSSSSSSPSSPSALLLIGRRELRSNNSWLHNSPRLLRGASCTLLMHPADAQARALATGDSVTATSTTGKITLPVEVTDAIMPGVVSVPHGWGHGRAGTAMAAAATNPGVSVNDITDGARVDALSGNASFSGTPVEVVRAST